MFGNFCAFRGFHFPGSGTFLSRFPKLWKEDLPAKHAKFPRKGSGLKAFAFLLRIETFLASLFCFAKLFIASLSARGKKVVPFIILLEVFLMVGNISVNWRS